ncbi:MAG: HDIG domain-containing protein, partial [Magnetococcales bacterium]|nr:HDIG domain-containing protein [Magnetococcales bacterium]NGZ29377.1 HDIG domain-containing protein [Magnetococcales bacterium]
MPRSFGKSQPPSGLLRTLQTNADWFFFLLLVTVLTITYSPVAFRPPYLPNVGEISEHDVKADRDLLIEDQRSTENRREEAAKAVPPVYDWDTTWGEALSSQLREAFAWLETAKSGLNSPSEEAFLSLRTPFALRLEEDDFPEDAFRGLLEMNNYQPLLERIQGWLTIYDRQRVVAGSETLRDLAHASYTVRAIAENAEFRDTGNAGLYSPEEMRRQMFRSAVTSLQDLPHGLRKWLLDWVRVQIRPNFVYNLAETKNRRAKAMEAVDTVYFRVRQGEMVVREGESVTNTMRIKLETLSRTQWTGTSIFRIVGLASMLAMFLALSRHFLLQTSSNFPRDKKTLYILGTIVLVVSMLCTITLVVGHGLAELFNWPLDMVQLLPPVAMGSSMVSLIIGSRVALPGGAMLVGTLLSFLAALAANGGLSLFFYYLVGSLVGGFSLRTCRRRFDVLKAGGFIGLFQLLSMPLMEAISGSQPSWNWLLGMAAAVTSGFLVGLLSLATIPLLEMIFDVTTDSRLLELASGDHPLLKQLSLRAPGTYHHSVMMGNLAEAAAESVGANPLLARVMALYH